MGWRTFQPREAALEAVEAARRAVGEKLVSATLYGSAAMNTFDPDRSDLNLAFLFTSLDAGLLESLRPARSAWRKRRLVRPLLLTHEILETSRDTFPLEYLLIQAHHESLAGADPFASISIEREALRLQVERTLRTQSLALAWSYLDAAVSPTGARHWATRAGTALAASVSGLLHLSGEAVPGARRVLAARAAARFGISEESLLAVLVPPSERPSLEQSALFGSAHQVVSRLLDAAQRLDASPERVS
jgi:predicted nucleotidyltransferase